MLLKNVYSHKIMIYKKRFSQLLQHTSSCKISQKFRTTETINFVKYKEKYYQDIQMNGDSQKNVSVPPTYIIKHTLFF